MTIQIKKTAAYGRQSIKIRRTKRTDPRRIHTTPVRHWRCDAEPMAPTAKKTWEKTISLLPLDISVPKFDKIYLLLRPLALRCPHPSIFTSGLAIYRHAYFTKQEVSTCPAMLRAGIKEHVLLSTHFSFSFYCLRQIASVRPRRTSRSALFVPVV